MSAEKINVCITDDHRLVRGGIARILKQHDRIGKITEAENGLELINHLKTNQPDVVLLDLQMPIMGGVEVCRIIAKNYNQIKVIILTMNDGPEMVELLIRSGAHGFISKSADPNEVIEAVCSVVDKGIHNNGLVFNALKTSTHLNVKPFMLNLSSREIEIIRLICEELTMREISERLNISERTVHNHRLNIMTKLNVHNTVGIVKFAIQNLIV